MACPHCGSWAVKSDRALAGRMVCARCGQPLGLGAGAAAGPRRGRHWPARLRLPRGPRRLWLGLGLLVLISATLAGLEEWRPGGGMRQRGADPAWRQPLNPP